MYNIKIGTRLSKFECEKRKIRDHKDKEKEKELKLENKVQILMLTSNLFSCLLDTKKKTFEKSLPFLTLKAKC